MSLDNLQDRLMEQLNPAGSGASARDLRGADRLHPGSEGHILRLQGGVSLTVIDVG